MRAILIALLMLAGATAHAQLVTKGFLGATNAVFNTRINAANATNATQTAAIAALISGQVAVSNLLAMGITNIIAGANVTIATNSGALVISSSGATNNIPVLQGTNLQFEVAEFDFLSIGVLIPTNTVYVAETNTATTVAEGTNFVADFNYSEQIITVTNAVNFIHGTNLWGGANECLSGHRVDELFGRESNAGYSCGMERGTQFPDDHHQRNHSAIGSQELWRLISNEHSGWRCSVLALRRWCAGL